MNGSDETNAADARAIRLAAALRDNLRRRKAQARGDVPQTDAPPRAAVCVKPSEQAP